MDAAGGQARAIMHRRAITRRRDTVITGIIIIITAGITTIIVTIAGDLRMA